MPFRVPFRDNASAFVFIWGIGFLPQEDVAAVSISTLPQRCLNQGMELTVSNFPNLQMIMVMNSSIQFSKLGGHIFGTMSVRLSSLRIDYLV